jgi:O-antigen/teichoic acid export membrane protein
MGSGAIERPGSVVPTRDAAREQGSGVGRRLLGETVVYGVALAVSRAAAFALVPVLTRVFSAAEYGTYDLVSALARVLFVPAVLGLDIGVALMLQKRETSGQASAVASCLAAQVVWGGLVTGTALLAAPMLSMALFGDADRTGVVRLAVIYLALMVANNYAIAVVKWKRQPLRYLALTVSTSVLSVGASLVAVLWGGGGVPGALLGLILGNAVCLPLAAVFLKPDLASRIRSADIAEALRLGLPFAAVSASEVITPFLLRLMLVNAAGLAVVGIFGALNTICLALMMINDAFANAWWPFALSPDGRGSVQAASETVMRIYACFLIVMAAVLSLLAEPLVAVLLGGGAYLSAAAAVGPLAFAYWLKSVRQNINVDLVLAERNWARAMLNIATLGGSLALAYPLILWWGVSGAAWGFAGGEALGLAVQTLLMRRAYKLPVETGAPARIALTFLALILIMGALPKASIGLEIIERSVLMILFLAALLLLRVISVLEIANIAALVLRLARLRARPG